VVDAGSCIEVAASHLGVAFWLGFATPQLRVDTPDPRPGRWGSTVVPVLPGRHEVEVWLPFLRWRRLGTANLAVEVPAGCVALVQWRAPAALVGAGRLTHAGVRRAVVDMRQPAGWYPDPTGRRQLRWWDGAEWTTHAQQDGVVIHDVL